MIQNSSVRRQAKPAQINLVALAGSLGLAAGIGIGLTKLSQEGGEKLLALGIAAGGIGSTATYLVMDSRHTARRNELEAKVKNANRDQADAEAELNRSVIELKAIQAEIESLRKVAAETELALKTDLQAAVESYRKALEAQCTTEVELVQAKTKIDDLQVENARLGTERGELITRLKALMDGMQDEVAEQVERQTAVRVDAARRGEIKQIATEYESLTFQLFSLFERLENWGGNVKESHDAKSVLLQGLVNQYTGTIDGLKSSVQSQTDSYLAQIEILNEKLGRAQAENRGEILEPQYGEFGFDANGKIANAIAREVFRDLGISLAVKGFHVKSDGVVDVGYGYSRSIAPESLVEILSRQSAQIATSLRLHRIVGVRKLEISDCIVLSYRTEPALKEHDVKLMVASADEFINYITAHPIRYRLIADPGSGKTPTTAVMVSEILKSGGTRGNTGKGTKIPNTLVTASCPDVLSSQKDADYPLLPFLKYGDTTSAIKSFDHAIDDWEYRKQNTRYAENFFQLWVWDELDNTLDSADEPLEAARNIKKVLKQAHHTGVGYIVSGQSVMTKQIPGFTNDDRSLFTEVIIGIPKIRKYLQVYGKARNSESNLAKLTRNLDAIEQYVEDKNQLITDDARLLRVALVVDSRSPKLYFLPNLDHVQFDANKIEETRRLSSLAKLPKSSGMNGTALADDIQNRYPVSNGSGNAVSPFPPMQPSDHSVPLPHCPHCSCDELTLQSDERYRCSECKKRFIQSKVVFK